MTVNNETKAAGYHLNYRLKTMAFGKNEYTCYQVKVYQQLLFSLTFCGFSFIFSQPKHLHVGIGPDGKSPDCILFGNTIAKELVWHQLCPASIYKAYRVS